MSDKRLLLHILKKVRDTNKERKFGICGEVLTRLKKYYGVPLRASTKLPNYKERCTAVVRVQHTLHVVMREWPAAAEESPMHPVEGSEYHFMRSQQERALWENPRRIALLDWLIKELESGQKATN